jgi:succinyl-diaminopimelate desuccinylase
LHDFGGIILKNISREIDKYKEQILADVVGLVKIPSFRQAPKDGMPFGEDSAKALNYCLELAENMGFKTKNVGNYAGHIEYGEGRELVGILVHCDVVPVGGGWTKEPFGGARIGNRIYGRGTVDDKGPAISAIYCLKALKDLNIVPKRRIRVIIGASEEIGTEDLDNYFASEEMPDMAFSPDSEYPICNREMGIMHVKFENSDTANHIKFHSGSAANIIPESAEAVVDAKDKALFEKQISAQKDTDLKFTVTDTPDGTVIKCFGKSAHASLPSDGINAAAGLINLISSVYKNDSGNFVRFLRESIGNSTDGSQMGVSGSDKESGALSLSLDIVDMSDSADSAVIDIRYPVTFNGKEIYKKLAEKAAQYGVKTILLADKPPLYVKESEQLIAKLKHAYTTVTGEEANVYASGGGTYARELKNGVAFGASIKPLSEYNMHGADEFLDIDDFMKHCEICLQAIYELSCE